MRKNEKRRESAVLFFSWVLGLGCSVHCPGTKACVQTTCHAGTVLEWSNSHKIPIDLIWTRIRNGLVMWGDCQQSIFCATMITTSMRLCHLTDFPPFRIVKSRDYWPNKFWSAKNLKSFINLTTRWRLLKCF